MSWLTTTASWAPLLQPVVMGAVSVVALVAVCAWPAGPDVVTPATTGVALVKVRTTDLAVPAAEEA